MTETSTDKLFSKYKDLIAMYFENNAKNLHKVVDSVLKNLHFYDVDKEDFYSLANELFITEVLKHYDDSQNFEKFLYHCLYRKFCTYMTRINRKKRKNIITVEKKDENGNILKDSTGKPVTENIVIPDKSIYESVGDEDGSLLLDFLHSDENLENEMIDDGVSEKVELFLSELPEVPCKIAELIMKGMSPDKIREKLNLTDRQYKNCWAQITSYEKKRILYKDNNMEDDEMNRIISTEDVAESYKNTSYSVSSICKQLRKKRIKDDHILQRYSGQWQKFAKSELISDILRGKSLTQIIISEEIKNGLRMQWLIDGKQRCTTLDEYVHDDFAISKNIKNYNIKYQSVKLDEEGNEVLNEDGFTEMEFKEFDVRGKKFSQLPEELQDIFLDRQIPVLYNMNCTKKDIADDIARFNRSRPMNKAQNGWLGLDESFAELVENIAKMQFFQPAFKGSSYTDNNRKSGTIRRIIVESIMISDFMEDYVKDFNKMCAYLTNEAGDSNFTEFYSFIERLTAVCGEETADVFNAKDSFIWFGLFSRFVKYENDDNKFVDFIKAFKEELHKKKVGDVSYDDLEESGTKDKNVVANKIHILETLMQEFLHIKKEDLEEVDIFEFVKENVNPEAIIEDIEFHSDNLTSWTIGIPENSRINDAKNKPSMIAIATYAFENEESCDDETMIEWFAQYEMKHQNFILNQKQNYLHMKENLDKYIENRKEQVA